MALTIRDIAKLAGVSRGTVDRVLHNRGRVDPEVEQRVKAIVRECNYQPSRAAQQLSMRKQKIRIGFLCRIDQNGFWSIVIHSADRAERELSEYGITVEKRFFDYCRPETQLEMIDELVAQDISALVIVPLDDPLICRRLKELKERGIVIILLQSEVSGFSPFCYIGSDYYVGGRTAAGLLHNFTAGRPASKILLMNGSPYLSSQRLRRNGFLDELRSYNDSYELVESDDITSDQEYAYHQARTLLEAHPDATAVYTVPNSAAAVSRAIRDLGRIERITHIGFGMTDATRPCILDGSISAIIGHRAEQQGSLPFSILLEYFISGQLPQQRRILMLNDIFIKQNSVF